MPFGEASTPPASANRPAPATAHAFVAASLDGFIAREDGGLDWLEVPGAETEDHGYAAFMASIDGLIMGRATYETVLGFGDWPYEKPAWVLSRSLSNDDVPEALIGRVRILADTPEEALWRAGRLGWRRVYADGGRLLQAFLAEGLLADLILTRIPRVLGAGRPLFPRGAEVPLRHEETTAFPSGLVQSRYTVLPA